MIIITDNNFLSFKHIFYQAATTVPYTLYMQTTPNYFLSFFLSFFLSLNRTLTQADIITIPWETFFNGVLIFKITYRFPKLELYPTISILLHYFSSTVCCVFWPANGCSACCFLVKIERLRVTPKRL